MPADFDTRTWRPTGARFAGLAAMLAIVLMCGVVWVAWGPRIQGYFNTGQRLTIIGLFLMLFAAWWAVARSRLTADPSGVTVVNGYRTRRFEWAQVVDARLRHGAPWAEMDLSDGTTVVVFGVQSADGSSAHKAMKDFRGMLAAHSGTEPDR
ncbi:MAG TPA: PH domain-containing protein [Marmoricola sp.]|nr:PH domain-containing protein [Marmoricola sp.]